MTPERHRRQDRELRAAMKWANDYGDIPVWYWASTAFQRPRALEDAHARRRSRAALAALALAAAPVL